MKFKIESSFSKIETNWLVLLDLTQKQYFFSTVMPRDDDRDLTAHYFKIPKMSSWSKITIDLVQCSSRVRLTSKCRHTVRIGLNNAPYLDCLVVRGARQSSVAEQLQGAHGIRVIRQGSHARVHLDVFCVVYTERSKARQRHKVVNTKYEKLVKVEDRRLWEASNSVSHDCYSNDNQH